MKQILFLGVAGVALGLSAGQALSAEAARAPAALAQPAPAPAPTPVPRANDAGIANGLEGTQTEPPAKRDEPSIIIVPQPQARPSDAPKLQDRTNTLLGETEILDIPITEIPNYREYMRSIVEDLAVYAHARNPKFIVVTRGGFDLLDWSQREYDLEEVKRDPLAKVNMGAVMRVGMIMRRYLQRVDGVMLNGQLCAPLRVPQDDLGTMMKQGVKFLSIEHCRDDQVGMQALQAAQRAGIVSHVDTDAEDLFAKVPRRRPVPENAGNVENLSEAKNMLVMTESHAFSDREEWIEALRANNYDVLVTDAFFRGNQSLTKDDIHKLKFKELGARRMVLARINVGFAEDERFYFKREWRPGEPTWIKGFDSDQPGAYVVEYWNPAWKAIIGKYFAGIMDLGFDGIVIDGVEAYRRWEFMTPIDSKKRD